MMKNILLTVAYDGSGFHGWQRQLGARTVQGELEKALSHTMGRDITVEGTSRTDAGVHAYGQRAGFRCDINVPVDKLPMILNNSLSRGKIFSERIPGEIKVMNAVEMPQDFHARFNAVGKKYIYKIKTGSEQDIFKRNYFYQLNNPLDLTEMNAGAAHITGTHDFKSFETSGGTERETTVRTIWSLHAKPGPGNDEIIIEVTGDGFLYNMVRIIVGTLVEIGAGRRPAEEMEDIMQSCDRTNAGHTAPPSGLYLAEVYYDKSDIENGGKQNGSK